MDIPCISSLMDIHHDGISLDIPCICHLYHWDLHTIHGIYQAYTRHIPEIGVPDDVHTCMYHFKRSHVHRPGHTVSRIPDWRTRMIYCKLLVQVFSPAGAACASFIWNPYEVYSRYMPGIFHVYVGPQYIHGIYYVYAKYIRILVLCIAWSFNVVNPCHGWGQSNVEDITFQHSIIPRDSNATWFHGIYLTYTCIYLVYARHVPFE